MDDIVINGLCKSFGNKIVFKNFSAKIPCGKTTSLSAPSGAGKTTLLRILMGLEKCEKGNIQGLEGVHLSAVFQEDRLCEGLCSISNVKLVSKKSENEIIEALKRVGLEKSLNQPVSELSGGMRRRVAIVRALLAEYDFLILDEPLKGLDPHTKHEVAEYILEKTKGKTVILVTHNEEEEKLLNAVNKITLMVENA